MIRQRISYYETGAFANERPPTTFGGGGENALSLICFASRRLTVLATPPLAWREIAQATVPFARRPLTLIPRSSVRCLRLHFRLIFAQLLHAKPTSINTIGIVGARRRMGVNRIHKCANMGWLQSFEPNVIVR